LGVPIFFYDLGAYSVVSGDEAFYQCVAIRMWESGDWFTVHFADRDWVFLMNSALPFWARTLLIGVLGDNLWSMRLLSACFGLLSVLMTYALARRALPRWGAFLSAFLLMTSFQFVYLHGARTGELDAIVVFVFVWIVREFLVSVEESRSFLRHHLALATLLALKLPLVLFPLVIELVYFAVAARDRPHFRRWIRSLWIASLGLAWVALQAFEDPAGFRYVVARMLKEASRHSAPLEYYAGVVFFGLFPQILLVPYALVLACRSDVDGRRLRTIATIASVVVLAGFTAVGKKFPWYVLPAYPFLSILVGDWIRTEGRAPRRWVLPVLAVAAVAAFAIRFEWPSWFPRVARLFVVPDPELHGGAAWLLPLAAFGLMLAPWGRRLAIRRLVMAACVGAVVVAALARTLEPLPDLRHVSTEERLASDLAGRLQRGEHIAFPFELPPAPEALLRYYFEPYFRVEVSNRRAGHGARGCRLVGPRDFQHAAPPES
jgi:4-amino-4-deoxy-L-arabinose transferase-like glycosyltransferase